MIRLLPVGERRAARLAYLPEGKGRRLGSSCAGKGGKGEGAAVARTEVGGAARGGHTESLLSLERESPLEREGGSYFCRRQVICTHFLKSPCREKIELLHSAGKAT